MKHRGALIFWSAALFAWIILLAPSLIWWRESLTWIIIMSWWANVAASAAAFYSLYTDTTSDKTEVPPDPTPEFTGFTVPEEGEENAR